MHEHGVMVAATGSRLGRLLTNLRGQRRAARRPRARRSRSAGQGDEAVLEVSDDGAGVAPDKRELVFQRFTRLDAARNSDTGGTGLGLCDRQGDRRAATAAR